MRERKEGREIEREREEKKGGLRLISSPYGENKTYGGSWRKGAGVIK